MLKTEVLEKTNESSFEHDNKWNRRYVQEPSDSDRNYTEFVKQGSTIIDKGDPYYNENLMEKLKIFFYKFD